MNISHHLCSLVLGRLRAPALSLALLGGTPALLGCAGSVPPPITSDTQLGQVIIYRNGVAYFERYAEPELETLNLRVPSERLDDFLKSLTIVDEKTGEAMPVSFPTLERDGDEVDMVIPLPAGHNRLKITYVTENPAWKPSYRILLGDNKPAKVEGWAIIENVSDEDWSNVKVGVGSTSALSFRYDLHSVRLVERQTLSSGNLLALAPPTGGSPYAVATRKVRVLGNLQASDLTNVGQAQREMSGRVATGSSAVSDVRDKNVQSKKKAERQSGLGGLDAVTNQVQQQAGHNRIRIEGFAQAGDSDPRQASLARANIVKDQLVRRGIDAGQIDVIGTGQFNNREAVRVVETDQEVPDPQSGELSPPPTEGEGDPLGHAHFVAAEPMTIKGQYSAMVSILNAETTAERVFFYDPVSSRGSKEYAFNAVRMVNPSPYTLDSGPFTVYAEGQFLGEGLSEPILPKSVAFIPYALDRSIIADPQLSTREEIEKLLTIQRGIVSTETRRIRRTVLSLTNRGKEDAKVYVRHAVKPGFNLTKKSEQKVEKLGGAFLFPVMVKGGEGIELLIEEWTPILKTVDIRTDRGVKDIALFLRKKDIDAKLRSRLEEVIAAHKSAAELQERIDVLDEQMRVYRTRVDEINVQLVTLKKVAQAAKLRGHLADKMQEISERLQKATMDMTDLKGKLMANRIELQDKLAELTMKPQPDKELLDEGGAGAGQIVRTD